LNLNPTSPIAIPSAPPTNQASESLASSLSNADVNEGILIQDVEVEVDTTDGEGGSAVGQLDSMATDEDSKRSLRDKLRETLSKRHQSPSEFRPNLLACLRVRAGNRYRNGPYSIGVGTSGPPRTSLRHKWGTTTL
jgi:hypothetical protein